ncbi:MAG: 16S rRNA (guanine(966)-N(2))-methyltransferase RsmD [Candidatus Margulisbacteria bacterium]|nr:16S rRNA (guanine(966)-N(2))-methyltransferase RsmD [Candidatus Margulisiibacteriota bacterium]
MRVISGSAKGRKLKVPLGNVRPLTGQAKEALFNILQNRIVDCRFLDLFAGSGAVGIEALSRGAAQVTFIELDRKSVQVIRENLEACGFSSQAKVYSADVLQALKILKRRQAKFAIIFLGAPYDSPVLDKALQFISECGILDKNGVFIAEHRKQHILPDRYGKYLCVRSERYGETVFNFYEESNLSG